MSDAPETIWVKPQHDSWNQYGHWYSDSKGGGEEYTRTDTIDAIKAQVWQEAMNTRATPKVKPLVWEVFDYATAWAKSPFGTYQLDGVLLSLSTQKNYIGDGAGNHVFNDLEAAKAAAQADYERRILEALDL